MNDPHEFLTTCAAPNWDSYGAAPVTEEAVRAADRGSFGPTPLGGVMVHWDGVEVEFGPDGSIRAVSWEAPDGE